MATSSTTYSTQPSNTRNKWAWALWLLFATLVTVKKGLDPADHSNVFWIYREGAAHWLNALPLYDGSGHGFIYLPQSSILFSPFASIPEPYSSLIWRPINIGVFAFGVYGLSRLARSRYSMELFLPVTVVTILMSASAAKLGQMTLIITGMMMLAVVDLTAKNWWRSAFWLVLSFAFKPMAIVLMLLMGVLYPRILAPVFAFLIVLVLAPFLLQDPAYVWDQYLACLGMLQQVASLGEQHAFAQPFSIIKSLGVAVPDAFQFLVRGGFAMLTLGSCWWLRDKQTPQVFAVYLFTLSVCYLLLFNPRTENNTYAMLGPAIGIFTTWSFQSGQRALGYAYVAIIALFMLSYRIGKWLTGVPPMWIKPLLCIGFLVLLLGRLRQDIEPNESPRSG